jgi:hypothetical protein
LQLPPAVDIKGDAIMAKHPTRRRTDRGDERQTREDGTERLRGADDDEDRREHFPWGGGPGPVRWSEGYRRRASEEDWRGPEQVWEDRLHGDRGDRRGERERRQRPYVYPEVERGEGPWGSPGYFDSGSRGEDPYGKSWLAPSRPGGNYGRGPKGYRRTDERILEDVNEALYRDHIVDASDVEVEVQEGEVTLRGTVTEREAKRAAEDCAWSVSGVRNVTTLLRVDRDRGSRERDDDGASAGKKTTAGSEP